MDLSATLGPQSGACEHFRQHDIKPTTSTTLSVVLCLLYNFRFHVFGENRMILMGDVDTACFGVPNTLVMGDVDRAGKRSAARRS